MSTTISTAQANAALGRQFFAEQDRVRGGPSAALCASGYTATIGSNPPMALEGHQAFAAGFYAGFPDANHEIEDVIAGDDAVVVRFVLHGLHRGDFFGIQATERRIRVPAHAILWVAGGRVTRLKAVFDEAGLLRQIGVLQG